MNSSLKERLAHTFQGLDHLPAGLDGCKLNHGKVRDYFHHNDYTVMVTSDRLSAFDRVLTTIPYKGELLNKLNAFWLKQTKDLVPNYLISTPHPNVLVGKKCEVFPIEVIVRGYITGSAWGIYQKGKTVSGIKFPEGLRKNEKLVCPVITPTTKADVGLHDEEISKEEILEKGLMSKEHYEQVEEMALKLFCHATRYLESRNLILVDTKYEFGIDKTGQVVVVDEIHTLDSSRYWIHDTYQARWEKGEDPEMLDKENIRRWLKKNNYSGDGVAPTIPDEERCLLTEKYSEAYHMITGEKFESEASLEIEKEVHEALNTDLTNLPAY